MLVGRARELDDLEHLLDAASTGQGGLRVIFGEPGIGKTRLADELAARARARQFTVSWGRAWETGGAPAYWPWLEILGPLTEGASDVPPRLTALLDRSSAAPRGDGTRADPARERFELFEAVGSFLRSCARQTPLLLVFDDLHAADVASLELLSFVARGLRAARVAIVVTYRDAESRLAPVAEVLGRITREGSALSLRRLSGAEVAELVRHDRGHFDAALAAALFELTEGNPLFLCETLHVVGAGSGLVPLSAMRDISVAGGVLAVVRGRLSGADPGLRALLDVAAVLGREVSLSLLSESSGLPAELTQRGLEEATLRGLLQKRGDNRWLFSHVLVREAFYHELSERRRCELHLAVADALGRRGALAAGGGELATLAHHALASLPMGDALGAIRTARLAADHARSQLAYEEAIALLERALTTCDRLGVNDVERAEVELALGWASTEAGRLERGRDLFRSAARTARAAADPALLARAALGQGGEYVLAEIRSELVDVLREALAALGEPTQIEARRLRARLLARLAAALTPSATPEEPLGLAREALAMTVNEVDARTRIDVDVGVGAALMDFAPPGERIPVNERLLRDARAVGDRVLRLRALTRLACDHLERGDVAAADAAIAARAALADAIGHPRYQWQTPLMRSMRAMTDGRFEDCEAEINEARRIAAEVSDPNAERCIEIHRLSMLLVAGRTEDLRAQWPAALRVLGSLPDGLALHTWVTALVSARLGDAETAAQALRSLGRSSVMTARMARASLADAALLAGVPEVYDRVYQSFSDDDVLASWGPFAFACGPPIARLLGAIAFARGRLELAVRHCERALILSTRMDASAHQAWVHLTWGEGLTGAPEARAHLEQARALADKLHMPEVLKRAQSALDQGIRAAPSQPAASSAAPAFSLRREAAGWLLEHAGCRYSLKDLRGLGMLQKLLEVPQRELHVLDLATETASEASAVIDLGDSGELLDSRARDAYKQRILDLREQIEEAERFADSARVARLRYELDALTDQIAGAVGLGGRERRSGSNAERARIVVQRRVREAIKKIAELDAELGRHLDWTVRTGTFCAYEPSGRRAPR
ncbi:MAG TPA: BREX system ATP-binding domain-containing protein [Polyangiaceae bacterium]